MIKNFSQAHRFVRKVKVCTLFSNKKLDLPSLWDNVDLPERQPGEKGWGKKMNAVWTWKNRLPAEHPEDIFYGKIKGGIAVLMDMEHLREVHFPENYVPVEKLKPLSQTVFEYIEQEPYDTTELRNLVVEEHGCSKSQFDTALKQLQVSMNVVRSNHPNSDKDIWLRFREQYPEIWKQHNS